MPAARLPKAELRANRWIACGGESGVFAAASGGAAKRPRSPRARNPDRPPGFAAPVIPRVQPQQQRLLPSPSRPDQEP